MRGIAVVGLLCALPVMAEARLAIAGNDGKQIQAAEQIGVTPDSVSVIDLAAYPPKVIGQVQVPAAMIGPPEAVAVSRDDSFAIVTAAQKINPALYSFKQKMVILYNQQIHVLKTIVHMMMQMHYFLMRIMMVIKIYMCAAAVMNLPVIILCC